MAMNGVFKGIPYLLDAEHNDRLGRLMTSGYYDPTDKQKSSTFKKAPYEGSSANELLNYLIDIKIAKDKNLPQKKLPEIKPEINPDAVSVEA